MSQQLHLAVIAAKIQDTSIIRPFSDVTRLVHALPFHKWIFYEALPGQFLPVMVPSRQAFPANIQFSG